MKNFVFLHQFDVEEWSKMQIYLYDDFKILQHMNS